MKVLGLTGGIGMGKSALAQILRSREVPVVDTDDLAREVIEPGQPALTEIQRVFGNGIIDAHGCLRREVLAQRVFSHRESRRQLEAILHPRIRALWCAQLEAWASRGKSLGVVVIPLLFETGAQSELDATLCVSCSAATQYQRLLTRGWSVTQIEQRIAAQWSIDDKMLASDFVIWTEGGIDLLVPQLDRILASLAR
jgi:dephospho-CoA kinase